MTPIRLTYLISAMFFAAQVFTACAQPEAEAESAATVTSAASEATLRQAIDAYDAAVEARNFEQIVTISLPTKVLAVVMDQPDSPQIDTADAYAEMALAIEQAYATVEDFDYQYDLTTIDILKTETGLSYALLPTVTNITLSGYGVKSTGTTLAIFDEDQWFLLNPQDAESIGWFQQAYPSLESVDLQPNEMEVVD